MSSTGGKLPSLHNASHTSILDQIQSIANESGSLPPVKKKRKKKRRPNPEESNISVASGAESTRDMTTNKSFIQQEDSNTETVENFKILERRKSTDQINSTNAEINELIDHNHPDTEDTRGLNVQDSVETHDFELTSEIPQLVNVNEAINELKINEEKLTEILVRSNNFINVPQPKDLRKPEKISVASVPAKPDTGFVYIQTQTGFQQRNRADINPILTTDQLAIKNAEDDYQNFGEGLLTFIRNFSRFILGIIAASTGFLAGILQRTMTISVTDDAFTITSISLSALCCICGVGTLTFVDPAGHGGLRRTFKMDAPSLMNLCVFFAILMSAIGDVLIGQIPVDEEAELININRDILIVYWLRFSLLFIAWLAMAFTEPPGGALYERIKLQNRIIE